jgi:ribosomal protein S27AE
MHRLQSQCSATRVISSNSRRKEAYMLDGNEICPNQGNMIYLAEHTDNARVFNAGNEDSEKISQKRRLLLKVECERLVVSRKLF